MRDRIVAVGLLTQKELGLLGPAFDRAFPVEDSDDFDGLLKAIDEAEECFRSNVERQPQAASDPRG